MKNSGTVKAEVDKKRGSQKRSQKKNHSRGLHVSGERLGAFLDFQLGKSQQAETGYDCGAGGIKRSFRK
jgi:hypothetical protein